MWTSWMSNFDASLIEMDGDLYPSVEHAFQAAKVPRAERGRFLEARTPGQAKRLGRQVHLPTWWEEKKVGIMLELVRRKFTPGTALAHLLVDTGDEPLEEVNTWGDRFWGTVNGVGENWMGKLLMQVRAELKEETWTPMS